MLLSKSQRIGAAILFGIAFVAWIVVAVWPSGQPDLTNLPDPESPKHYRTWEERKDSMRRVDSIRYAEWAMERELRYDSFRIADSLRRLEWREMRRMEWDSIRTADSLWRDSMGIHFTRYIKKDTIIDLNHCDTTELLYIRGIGRYTAIRIVQYREQLGGYYSPLQLLDEPFAQCHLDTLLTRFTADTTAIHPMHVNSCSIDVLQRHPYLRYNQAKAIYNLRRQRVRLKGIEDIQLIPELPDSVLLRLVPYLSFE